MFAFLRRKSEPAAEAKKVLLTIHGYGRRRSREFDNLALWCSEDQMEIIQFDLFDLYDEKDNDWMLWAARAKKTCEDYIRKGYVVDVVGFSMGGVIAAYVAATCEVHRLILLAPAFHYLNFDKIYTAITKQASRFFSSEENKSSSEIVLPASFDNTFISIGNGLKKFIAHVQCPVLLLHGDQDEVIAVRSSIWAYEQIPHARKQLFLLHGGTHRLLMDPQVGYSAYQLICAFVAGKLIPNREITFAPDPLAEMCKEEEQ